jgi:cytosine/adenosine deaminase-related metal-dependent hydrolase
MGGHESRRVRPSGSKLCFVPETLIPSQVELFHLGATEAARVLGQEKTLGQLKSGYSADLVVWDVSNLMPYRQNLLDLKDPNLILSRLMYRGALARAVKVWVAGKPV